MTPLFTILRPHPTLKTGLYCISVEDRDGYPAKIALEILKNDKTARIAVTSFRGILSDNNKIPQRKSLLGE